MLFLININYQATPNEFRLSNLAMTNISEKSGFASHATRIESENYIYQVYIPPQIKDFKKPPIIIFLHGIRERGTSGFVAQTGPFRFILEQYLSRLPAIVLLPQCRPGKYWSDPLMDEMVMRELAETSAEFDADTERISLLGVSMGGYGAWHFAAKYPERFAALISICGGSPILTGDRFAALAAKVKNIPAWVFHGADDRVVPVSESREIVKALETIGGDIRYSEYPNIGHNVWLQALGEPALLPWLLAQRDETAAN